MEVDGGGKVIPTRTSGTAVREVMKLVRGRSRHLASGGLCRVRTAAAAAIQRHLPITATAVSMATFMYARRPNIRRMAVNVTVRQKKQSNTAGLTGAVLTEKWFKLRGPSARQKASSVTTRSAKQRKIADQRKLKRSRLNLLRPR